MPASVSGKRITLEVCVTTADEAVTAAAAGADRLELCTALEVGGVTPSPGAFLDARAAVRIPTYVLIRPRPGGFVYAPREFATIRRDAEWFLTHGADGIVCGVLDESGRLNNSGDLVRAARGRAVLHRAFDFLPNPFDGLTEAIDLGFERVLTSGGASTAVEGADVIWELRRLAAGRIEILPGSGIKPGNVAELVRTTGCDQVHGSFRSPAGGAVGNPFVAAGMGSATRTDPALVAAVRAELDRLRESK
jgi:copper homeostasis protein